MKNFMKNPSSMLFYHGSPGCGKTYFCAAITEWAIKNFFSYRKYRELDLLSKLRKNISSGHGNYAEYLLNLIDDPLIIMDDVGSGISPNTTKDYEWRKEIFLTFLDTRYNDKKNLVTIITSNFTRNEIEYIYGERSHSRLFAKENTIIKIFGSEYDKRKTGL